MISPRRTKIAIIGAGSVGATVAYACQIKGVAQSIALVDTNAKKVRAEVLDLNHGRQFAQVEVLGSDDYEVVRDSDIIITTAGAKQDPGQTRMDLAATNVAIMRSVMDSCLRVAPDAMHLVVSNPCDVLTYAALKFSGLPPWRVMGSGTVLDSSRFRFLLAQQCRVAEANVHAFIVGEHGDSELPLWSIANVGGVPISEFRPEGRDPLTAEERASIKDSVVNAAYEIIEGKGATWYAVGLAVARIVEAILDDQRRVLPVSSLLRDYRGVSDVCLSVPTVLDQTGVAQVLDVPMSDEELAGLRASAETVRAVNRSLGL